MNKVTTSQEFTKSDEFVNEITLLDLIKKLKNLIYTVKKNFILITFFVSLGALLGFFGTYFKPVKYTARSVFYIDDSKGAGSGIANLAGQFGLSIGGGLSSGVFSGENIIYFMKSRSVLRETLLSSYNEGEGKTFADIYIEKNNLKFNLIKTPDIRYIFNSFTKTSILSRFQDSLLQHIENRLIQDNLIIERLDKNPSFVEAKFVCSDEKFSYLPILFSCIMNYT